MPVAVYSGDRALVFGDGEVFLGCLSCTEYDRDSIFNPYGPHGSRFAADSIFNHYGDFGSRYSSTSACNVYATDPPVIVTEQGAFVAYLTMNPYKRPRVSGALLAILEGVCGEHE